MKIKEFKDLKLKDASVLVKIVNDKKKELEKAMVEIKVTKEKNLKKAKMVRREIAQLLTVIREKEIIGKEGSDLGKK